MIGTVILSALVAHTRSISEIPVSYANGSSTIRAAGNIFLEKQLVIVYTVRRLHSPQKSFANGRVEKTNRIISVNEPIYFSA